MLDRTTPPAYGDIRMPSIPDSETRVLPNGFTIITHRGGQWPIVRLNIYFPAGSLRCERALVANATAEMLNEGTKTRSAQEIAEKLEFLGVFSQSEASSRDSCFTAFTQAKDFSQVVPLIYDFLRYPTFPDKMFDIYRASQLQLFDENELKTSRRASTTMLELLYPQGSRYGRYAKREDFLAMTPQMLRDFHAKVYSPAGAYIFVDGQVSDSDLALLEQLFGDPTWVSQPIEAISEPEYLSPSTRFVPFESQQTSISMRCPSLPMTHPDWPAFYVLNCIFGGFFGTSRLMKNIREKLGLTYGIGSYYAGFGEQGIHSIFSEVKSGEHQRVIDEISAEMHRLHTELVPEDEMAAVRGYMLGELLQLFSNFLSATDAVQRNIVNKRPSDYYKMIYEAVRDVTSEQIRDVANRWLKPENYCVAAVGNM